MVIFVSSWFWLLAEHSCQTPSETPIILLPAPSRISYESLHYPIPPDQYQLIPFVINTGKIPLINHPVQAPIQYLIPHRKENQQVAKINRDLDQYSFLPRGPTIAKQQSDKYQIRNSLTKKNYYSPTTIFSKKHVDGLPSSKYSYGYEIIEDDIGGPESMINGQKSRNLEKEPDRIQRVYEYIDHPEHNHSIFNTVVHHRHQIDKTNDDLNQFKDLKSIIVKPDLNTINTQLKKHYKNATNLVIPSNTTINQNNNLTSATPQ